MTDYSALRASPIADAPQGPPSGALSVFFVSLSEDGDGKRAAFF
jgi:hypothetical protein